jgi:fatty-acyl-CoA synthase
VERSASTSELSLRERESSLPFDDAVNIQYTSGTTGSPKGATLSHHNILNNGFFIGEALAYTERDRICLPVPFYHCFGCVLGNLAVLTHASAVVLPGDAFDADAVLRTVETERCTSLYGVPRPLSTTSRGSAAARSRATRSRGTYGLRPSSQ